MRPRAPADETLSLNRLDFMEISTQPFTTCVVVWSTKS